MTNLQELNITDDIAMDIEQLTNNGFKKVFKTKMFYRKTFEYIYKNTKI